MSMMSLGYTIIALRISTRGSSCTKEELSVGTIRAFFQCQSVKSRYFSILFSSISNSLSFFGQLSSKNLAKPTEQQKLGSRYKLSFFAPIYELKYFVNQIKKEYCFPEMALKSIESKLAVGSLTLILSRNLLY